MLVDIYEKQRNKKPVYRKETFYGRLDHIFSISLPNLTAAEKETLGFDPETPSESNVVLLAAIRTCKLEKDDSRMKDLNIHFYSSMGGLHFIDITTIQCLVGRVKDGERGWAIIDRNGALSRAIDTGEDGDDDL